MYKFEKDKIPAEPSKGIVIFIGARLAGLAAARKLMSFAFEVMLLEGQKRVGGRVYKKDKRGNKVTTADLGGIVLTGTLGNLPGLLSLQLSYTLHNYTTVAGWPLLLALVTGEVAHKFELTAPTDAVIKLLQILEGIYETQGINVPQPIRSALVPTPMMLWVHQEMTDILAETVEEGKLFFTLSSHHACSISHWA
ncbi:hypothetical protein KY290_005229 [Solanum tuberosum]|uniref:Amine oxidase domain-containing protein n=1 Tax=Solanum tuberosum TaxID=4113 RepID=A0ABQ7WFZ2_SOLTU|nr:hypothetical protein KY289_006901 [Solanum tuberosum]KAH0751958.1 hypothetical protein KY285_005106 [Solanum tuberosum]KAH0778802.1 hypothetical protein KY290_005229 [Solanum tuberosum]